MSIDYLYLLFSGNKLRVKNRQRVFIKLVKKCLSDKVCLNILRNKDIRSIRVILNIEQDDKAISILGQETKVKGGNLVAGV